MMMKYAWILLTMVGLCGCWDSIEHDYDDGSRPPADTGSDSSDNRDSEDTGGDDSNTGDSEHVVNSALNADWQGFGSACDDHGDCGQYPSAERRCIQDVLSIINSPGGYCTACCNAPGTNQCGPGVDCVGVDNVYLVCLSKCNSDRDCRMAEGWECRQIYYISEVFPDNYCLPNEDNMDPNSDIPGVLECPWHWL